MTYDKKLIIAYLVYFILCGLAIASMVRAQDSMRLTLSWDAITLNADGTPCTDLAGYLIYRSRTNTPETWENFIHENTAFTSVPADQTRITITCPEAGIWYWAIRGYNTSLNIGGYGGAENIIETDINAVIPGNVIGFQYCSAGDMDCDGDIDDVDLALFVEQYGKD